MSFSTSTRALAPITPHRRAARWFLALGSVLAVSACSSMDLGLGSEPPPPCPTVRLDRDTTRMEVFVGEGRDITDMAYMIEIQGYGGTCAYEDDEVIVELIPQFTVERGPAAPEGAASGMFAYFVAVPSYYPDPAGKQVFPFASRSAMR